LLSIICGVTEKRSPPRSLMKMAKVSLGDAVEGAREAVPSKPTPEQFVADSPLEGAVYCEPVSGARPRGQAIRPGQAGGRGLQKK
jgi:hypothetical protein